MYYIKFHFGGNNCDTNFNLTHAIIMLAADAFKVGTKVGMCGISKNYLVHKL